MPETGKKQPTYMITSDPYPVNETCARHNVVTIDRIMPMNYPDNYDNTLCATGLQIGDIVIYNDGVFQKKQYTDCEPAIVTHTDTSLNIITAFCAKYGDIMIRLENIYSDSNTPNPYIYTQRGDTILVQNIVPKNKPAIFQIVANLTVNDLRANFLRNNQKQK